MSLDFHARLTADGKQAAVEIRGTAAELDKLRAELLGVTKGGSTATKSLTSLERQSGSAAQMLRNANTQARDVAQTHTLAAGSVGNLTAQFNDIGMMLMAGQNPLQLAVQQGTQITQVIGPMGAAGAAKALGSAFVSMISPINLITIGTIAAGAALTNWLTSGSREAKTLADDLDDLRAAVEAYTDASELASASTDELRDRFGKAAGQVRSTLLLLEEIARSDAQRAIDGVNQSLADLFGIAGDGDRRSGIADFFDVNIGLAFTDAQREARAEARAMTAEFVRQQDALAAAKGDLEAQIVAMQGLLDVTRQLAAADGKITAEEDEQIRLMAEALLAMQEQSGEAGRLATSLDGARAIAERLVGSIDSIDFSSGIGGANVLVARLERGWQLAVGIAQEMSKKEKALASLEYADLAAGAAAYGGAQTSMRNQTSLQTYAPDGRLPSLPKAAEGRASGRKAAAAAAREEADAVADLIAQLQLDLDLAREQDPAQKEMIRNREVLASATAAERAEIQQLITLREEEAAAQQRLEETRDMTGDTVRDFFDAWREGGEAGIAALQRLEDKLWDVAMQALIFGEGPLGMLFGGGLMGLLGFKGGGEIPGYDSGGMIYGHGGPKDDRILMMTSKGPIKGSAGEFMVNAEATAKYRPLLEAINSGAPLPGFAQGGAISGGGDWSMAAPVFQFIDQSRGVDVETREQRTPEGGRLFQFVINDQVADAMTRPGSSANRALRQRGVRAPMVLR